MITTSAADTALRVQGIKEIAYLIRTRHNHYLSPEEFDTLYDMSNNDFRMLYLMITMHEEIQDHINA
jgi:hypothetical protein